MVALIFSTFGINPVHSYLALIGAIFFSILALVVRDCSAQGGWTRIVTCLLIGQTIAAMHTIFEGAYPEFVPKLFLGKVTESGQLGMTTVIALAACVYYSGRDLGPIRLNRWRLWAIVNFALFTTLGFARSYGRSEVFIGTVAIIVSCSLLTVLSKLRVKSIWSDPLPMITIIILPALCAALMINLKRGPWFGVFCGSLLFLLFFSRRLILPVCIGAVLLALAIVPLRMRLAESSRDFFISGGRSMIWEVGAELTRSYPLGIGFGNSPILREFNPKIPPELKHFHNNLLNVTVEAGWVGLGLFVFWLVTLTRAALSSRASREEAPIVIGLLAALLSWQLAGIVEYKFGDSEVFLVAMFAFGLILHMFERGAAVVTESRSTRTAISQVTQYTQTPTVAVLAKLTET